MLFMTMKWVDRTSLNLDGGSTLVCLETVSVEAVGHNASDTKLTVCKHLLIPQKAFATQQWGSRSSG